MLSEQDGALFIEWNSSLFHGISVEFFLALLRSGKLHFSRVSGWLDPNEGLAAIPFYRDSVELPVEGGVRRDVDVNYYGHCWTKSEVYDTVVLSDNYSLPREVAIRTTFRALHNSIRHTGVCAGLVSYRNFADFRQEDESKLTNFPRFFIKDLAFAPEREFRLLLPIDNNERDPAWITVEVELPELILEVFVRKRVSEEKFDEISVEMERIGIHGHLKRHHIF